jgi:predicted ABC-type transport system involved in lysophospholipase L1 biosynthesis ATPase subunit
MTGLHARRNVTLVLVTHDAQLAGEAERQVILKDGKVVQDSIRAQLFAH